MDNTAWITPASFCMGGDGKSVFGVGVVTESVTLHMMVLCADLTAFN